MVSVVLVLVGEVVVVVWIVLVLVLLRCSSSVVCVRLVMVRVFCGFWVMVSLYFVIVVV